MPKMTVQQAAKICRISPPRIIKLIYEGRLGEVEMFGKNYAIEDSAVEALRLELLLDSRSNLSQYEHQQHEARQSQPTKTSSSQEARKKKSV